MASKKPAGALAVPRRASRWFGGRIAGAPGTSLAAGGTMESAHFPGPARAMCCRATLWRRWRVRLYLAAFGVLIRALAESY